MKIVIGCDSFLALRNVRNAELGTRLMQHGHAVQVLVDPHQLEGARAAGVADVDVQPLQELLLADYPRMRRWLDWMEFSRKSFKDPITFHSKLEYRLANRRLMKYAVWPQLLVGWGLGAIGSYHHFRRMALLELRRTAPYQHYLEWLDRDPPRLVAGFSPEGYREMALLQAASDMGVPTIIMIRSRDNLASKIIFLAEADEYLVWSEHQRAYFRHMYPELRYRSVLVTGSPQFARHQDASCGLPRDEFFRRIGLDPARPLVVFCLENPHVVPHQGNMARALAATFAGNQIARGAQLLIRNHPRAFGSDFDPLGGDRATNVALYPEPTSIPFGLHERDLVRRVLEDEPMHLATMAHQDVNVNILSTATIDSAIFDKPIVHVAFDIPAAVSASVSVRRFFKRSDYRIIAKTHATDVAHSVQELVSLINLCLVQPHRKQQERATLVSQDIGIVGPESNEAVLNSMLRPPSSRAAFHPRRVRAARA